MKKQRPLYSSHSLKNRGSDNRKTITPLREYPGVPLEYAEVLRSRGILHNRHFLEVTRTKGERNQLAVDTGIPLRRLEEIRALSDLTLIPDVGPMTARLLYHAGIRSVQAMADESPDILIDKLRMAGRAYPEAAGSLQIADLRQYRQQAQEILERGRKSTQKK